jgi:hypothetical protein
MTEHKSFKRLVRARMAKTGESYTAARAKLLRAEGPKGTDGLRLATSDDRIRERTGHGWEAWFGMLDEWGAADRSHREIARWVAEQLGVVPLAWNAQAIASSYELSRGLRAVGEKDDATVTIALVPARDGVPSGVQTGIRLTTPDADAVHERLQARARRPHSAGGRSRVDRPRGRRGAGWRTAARWRLHPHEIEPGLIRGHELDLHQRLAYGASRNGG